MGAAIASMMFASCQNEMIENNAQQEGKTFTLVVNKDASSRTALKGLQTVWSEGDQIYVTSKDGSTTGVLTLQSGADEATATFKGLVFGNGKLTKAIFPVPSNNVIDLSKRSADEIDAPMVGTINGTSTTLENKAAIIKLNIADLPANSTLTISGDNIISSATWTGTAFENGTANKFVITGANDMEDIFVPVFVKAGATETSLSIKVDNGTVYNLQSKVALATNKVSVNVPTLVYSNGNLMKPGDQGSNASILTPRDLTSTFNAAEGQTYLLEGDFNSANVNIVMPVGIKEVVIDGTKAENIKELIITQNGQLIDHVSHFEGVREGKLTIKNFNIASQINVFASKTEVEICGNTAEALLVYAGNCALNIHDNEFDANFKPHTIFRDKTNSWSAANNYGVQLRIFDYDLWFDNNIVTDATGHVVAINGYEDRFGNAINNEIRSFTGNNITVNSTTNTKRAAFKIWADGVYAPQLPEESHKVVNAASQEFINDVLANGENTFNIVDGYNHTIFCIYDVNTNK